MCAQEFQDSSAGDLERFAWKTYDDVVKKLNKLQPLTPLPEISQDGSQAMHSRGTISVPSPGGMEGLIRSLSWALDVWRASGSMPDRDHLFTSVQSMGIGPIECIIMPLCLVHIISLSVLISSGENDSALQLLGNMTPEEGQRPTWQSTSSKISEATESGDSSADPATGYLIENPEEPKTPDSEAPGKDTNAISQKGTDHLTPSGKRSRKKKGKKSGKEEKTS